MIHTFDGVYCSLSYFVYIENVLLTEAHISVSRSNLLNMLQLKYFKLAITSNFLMLRYEVLNNVLILRSQLLHYIFIHYLAI